MQFGRYYEEFEVGAVYKHWPGKTVTEYDDHLFCLLTMNHHPLHLDANYATTTVQGKNVVVGNYIYSLLLGMSVPDVSGKAIANLEVESLRHVAPTFHGDTIYGETKVLGQDGVQIQGRPRRRDGRDHRLQPGRHGGLHLPPQGDGAQALVRGFPRRRAARPPRAGRPRLAALRSARNTPTREGLPQVPRHLALARHGPGHVVGVRRRGQRAAGHRAGEVGDVVPPDGDSTGQPVDGDHQTGLLEHLTHDRIVFRLARLDPAARQRPEAAARLVCPANEQYPALIVPDDGAHARHPARFLLRHDAPPGGPRGPALDEVRIPSNRRW